MKFLINYDHNRDQDLMYQNLDLALSVLKASTVAIPEMVKQMNTNQLIQNPLMFYFFIETLR